MRYSWLSQCFHKIVRFLQLFVSFPGLLLFLSLFLLRYQVVLDLNISWIEAWKVGLDLGVLYDLAVVLLPFAIARLGWALFFIPYRMLWLVVASVVWVSSLANVLYFRFFGSRLEWWVVELHWKDLAFLQGSASNLSFAWPVVVSACCFCLILYYSKKRLKGPPWPASIRALKNQFFVKRISTVFAAILIFVFSLLIRQSPVWFYRVAFQGAYATGEVAVLGEQVLTVWFNELLGTEKAMRRQLQVELEELKKSGSRPAELLAKYHKVRFTDALDLPQVSNGDWPLLSQFHPRPEQVRLLRRKLGLSQNTPINVMVIFLESTRMFELGNEAISPYVFPNLRKILKRHGILFEQAYSSSAEAGQTVRGQFSSLCSLLPNFKGPATYIAYNTINVRCLQDLLHENGYNNIWINSISKSFHSSNVFEGLHGTKHFYDESHFVGQGITKRVGDWGLADDLVLLEVAKILKRYSKEERPFFVNMLTMSPHFPHKFISESSPPEALLSQIRDEEYRGYLSQLHYLDRALGQFFEEVFKQDFAENTLFVLVGDHSVPVRPHLPLNFRQQNELKFRIPVALITKQMKAPQRIRTPVHQIDIAPTIARIAGVSGEVSWIGRGLFVEEASPWVYGFGKEISYRLSNMSCYRLPREKRIKCFNVKGADPLFDPDIPEITEHHEITTFFENIVKSMRQVIVFNAIAPLKRGAYLSTN